MSSTARSATSWTPDGAPGWETVLAALAAAVLVGTTMSALGLSHTQTWTWALLAAAAVPASAVCARLATGSRFAVPAVTAATLLTAVGVATFQEAGGEGSEFAFGGLLGLAGFVVVALVVRAARGRGLVEAFPVSGLIALTNGYAYDRLGPRVLYLLPVLIALVRGRKAKAL